MFNFLITQDVNSLQYFWFKTFLNLLHQYCIWKFVNTIIRQFFSVYFSCIIWLICKFLLPFLVLHFCLFHFAQKYLKKIHLKTRSWVQQRKSCATTIMHPTTQKSMQLKVLNNKLFLTDCSIYKIHQIALLNNFVETLFYIKNCYLFHIFKIVNIVFIIIYSKSNHHF